VQSPSRALSFVFPKHSIRRNPEEDFAPRVRCAQAPCIVRFEALAVSAAGKPYFVFGNTARLLS
jgi:hypothetical protein